MKAKDGCVVIFGTALDADPKVKFRDGKPTEEPDGYAVMFKTPAGFSNVKYGQRQVEDPSIGLPAMGESRAILARPYAWSQADQGNFGFAFVRDLTASDLDQIVTASTFAQEPAGAKG